MTTTNNSAKYAVSLDYEVREADNSINCKTAYKVFDNMQDAANYAIDFIANNPDANIRLTNEHFNGSQIKAYGNGSTKYYDLTDADINAVRNVEVNAVNAPADEITLDDILNDDEVSEHFQPVTVYVENQYGREVLVADGKVITEEEYYAMCIENCYNELRSMIKFYYKHHGLTLAQTEQIFMAIYIDEGNLAHDAIEQMIRDFKAANKPDDEPPTPPTPPTDRRAEIENAQAANVKEDTEMANINSNVTIDDNGKIFDSAKVTIDQAVNIISRLNYRNDTFQYRFTTREDNADIQYRHFDAYRQNGDKDAFAISEIVINGKLEIVRFYNLFRDIIVDLHIGNLNYTLGYRGAIEIADEQSVNYDRFLIDIDVENTETGNCVTKSHFQSNACDAANWIINFAAKHHNRKIISAKIRDFKFSRMVYQFTDADINALYPNDNLPEPPEDDFNSQLERLRAAANAAHNAEDAARRVLDETEAAYDKAKDFWRDAHRDAHIADVAITEFLDEKTKELRDDLLDEDIFNANIAIIAQAGKCFDQPNIAGIWIDATPDQKLLINSCTKFFATYDTPEQVRQAVNLLRDAINRGDSEFKFPTVDEFNTVRDVADTVTKLNANAPDGWEVIYDAEGKNFSVTCAGQSVAELDSLALAKVLPPDKFFDRFNPHDDNQHYADQLYREYEELLQMRDQLTDAERIKTIDGLIEDIKREMLNARLDLPTSTPTSAC